MGVHKAHVSVYLNPHPHVSTLSQLPSLHPIYCSHDLSVAIHTAALASELRNNNFFPLRNTHKSQFQEAFSCFLGFWLTDSNSCVSEEGILEVGFCWGQYKTFLVLGVLISHEKSSWYLKRSSTCGLVARETSFLKWKESLLLCSACI